MSMLPMSAGGVRAQLATAASIAFALPAAASAATYHVDPAGDDAAPGDEASPWKSLQHAADTVGPGDEVIVHEGRYVGFEVRASGTEAEPIVFSAESGVVIDRASASDGINLHGAADVVIEGFTVEGAPRAGIRGYECERVVIRDNKTDRNGIWGILSSFCDDITIEGNETSRSEIEHGIYVGNTCDGAVVVNNDVWGNYENGIHLNGDRHAGGGGGFVTNARVEGNVIYDNGQAGGSAINGDGLRDSVIVNNLAYDNGSAGISLYAIDGGGPSTGNTVAHNTIVMPPGARPAVQLHNGSGDNEVVNNIFVHADPSSPTVSVDEASLSGLVADHNAGSARYDVDGAPLSLMEWNERTGQGGSSFEAPPEMLFEDPAGGDFAPAADSPAVAAGSPEAADVDTDLNGDSRGGGAPDLGAISASASAADDDLGPPTEPGAEISSTDFPDVPSGGCGGAGGGGAGAGSFSLMLILAGLAAPRASGRIRLATRNRR